MDEKLRSEIYLMKPYKIIREFFGNFSTRSKRSYNNRFMQKNHYSNFFKTTEEFEESWLQDLQNLINKKVISENQKEAIKRYIENNVKHPKYGDCKINEKGEYVVMLYDLTTKNKSVYFLFGKEDKCIEVFKSKYGWKTWVNDIPIKTVFKNKEDFNKNLRELTEDELWKVNGLSKESLKEISKNINDLNNNKDLIDVLVKEKLGVELQSKQNMTDLFNKTCGNTFD